MEEKPYHVHGLKGYQKDTYVYLGNYYSEDYAESIARSFVSENPYGNASVSTNKEPQFTQD